MVAIYVLVLEIMTGDGFQRVDFAPYLSFSGAEERSERRENVGGRVNCKCLNLYCFAVLVYLHGLSGFVVKKTIK